MKKIISGVVICILLGIIGIFIQNSVLVITEKNEYTLIVKFGKIENEIKEPGWNLKNPFLSTAHKLPNTTMVYDLRPSEVITKDKKTMTTDSYVLWRISDPTEFAKMLNYSVEKGEERIESIVYNGIKTVMSSMDQNDVIDARDGRLQDEILKSVKFPMSQYGIEILFVEIKRLDLPEDNKHAVYDRMISERNKIAAMYTAEGESEAQIIRNSTDREININISDAKRQAAKIIAEGEGEYMRILANAYGDRDRREFYSFIRGLEASKKSLKSDKKNILILPKDSPISEIFMKKN